MLQIDVNVRSAVLPLELIGHLGGQGAVIQTGEFAGKQPRLAVDDVRHDPKTAGVLVGAALRPPSDDGAQQTLERPGPKAPRPELGKSNGKHAEAPGVCRGKAGGAIL